jgi:molecular chaperone GrpE
MAEDVKRSDDEVEIDAGDTGAAARPEAAAAKGSASSSPVSEVDYKDRWLRAEAELQNVRKRARRDVDDARRSAEEAVLLDLVSWLDDLERAVDAARSSGAAVSWVEGVALVLQKGREYLERMGVTAVDPSGLPFDPALHEAVLEVDPPENVAGGTVVQVIAQGYRRGTRSLRAARVVVARESGNA